MLSKLLERVEQDPSLRSRTTLFPLTVANYSLHHLHIFPCEPPRPPWQPAPSACCPQFQVRCVRSRMKSQICHQGSPYHGFPPESSSVPQRSTKMRRKLRHRWRKSSGRWENGLASFGLDDIRNNKKDNGKKTEDGGRSKVLRRGTDVRSYS